MNSATDQSEPGFSEAEREVLDEYRRVSVLAVGSLVLGVLSVGALAHFGFWFVPVVAVVCGIFGLRSIRKQDHVVGAVAAWAGILLSLMFLSWAVSQSYFSRWVINAEAQAVAERWFRLVLDGEHMIAHQAMLHPAKRQSSGLSVDEYYRMDAQARADMQKRFGQPPLSKILGLGRDAQITLVANVIQQDLGAGPAKVIRQIYRISAPGQESVDALMSLTREYRDDLGRATWIVADVLDPEDA